MEKLKSKVGVGFPILPQPTTKKKEEGYCFAVSLLLQKKIKKNKRGNYIN